MANRAVLNGREEGGGHGDEDSVLRLRWNSHVESLQQLFESLLEQQLFVDVTLACEGGSLRAHRVMLSACSSYFRRVLHEAGTKSPVIIMRDVPCSEMDQILQFIYRGEIHVPEASLPSLLRTARLLEIRGLSDDLEKPASEAKTQEAQTDTRKRRNSSAAGANGHSGHHHNHQLNGKAKKPTQQVEPVHEEMDSEPEVSQHAQNGNGHHISQAARLDAERRLSPPTPLDLSNGDICASDEENEVPDPLDTTSEKKTASPVPVLVKCETPATTPAAEEDDDDEEDDTASSTAEQYPFSMLAETDQSGSGGVVVQAVCPFCFKDCKRTAELRAHIRAHTGEKPFRCDICSAPFARSAHLKRHRRVHTGERPFECHRCQKTFSRQDKLKLHMDRHRLRDTGGKMIVGRPKKLAPKKGNNGAVAESSPGTSTVSSSSSAAAAAAAAAVELTGMGQFAFPGAPARPGPASSPSDRSTPSSSSSPGGLSFSDINYYSLLSLSQRGGLTITSTSQGSSDLPSPTVPNLLSPQALHELQLFRQTSPRGRPPSAHQQQRATRAAMAAAMAVASHHRANGRSAAESASETLLNFAQRVGEVVSPPPSASSS